MGDPPPKSGSSMKWPLRRCPKATTMAPSQPAYVTRNFPVLFGRNRRRDLLAGQNRGDFRDFHRGSSPKMGEVVCGKLLPRPASERPRGVRRGVRRFWLLMILRMRGGRYCKGGGSLFPSISYLLPGQAVPHELPGQVQVRGLGRAGVLGGVGDPARRSATRVAVDRSPAYPVSLATCATEYPSPISRRTSAPR